MGNGVSPGHSQAVIQLHPDFDAVDSRVGIQYHDDAGM